MELLPEELPAGDLFRESGNAVPATRRLTV
jgi:hypothetical protein